MNYLAIFCPELQKLLRPIYELTKQTVKIDFDCATDHLAAVQIMHSKDEPKGRIGQILDKIFEYTFRLYYVKGKDLILADYFSRVPADRRKVDEVIPISFVNLCRCDDMTMFGMTTRQ